VTTDVRDRPFLVLAWARDDAALRAALGSASSHYLVQTVRDGRLDEAFDAMTTNTPHRRVDDPLNVLTGQERRILDLIGEGLTNREISVRLRIAEKTVKNYVTSLLAKLGLQRRAQAAAYIARRQATHTA
jgi:two-component system, NarL family, response regulator DevR